MRLAPLLYFLAQYTVIQINCESLERKWPAVDMLQIYYIYRGDESTLYCISNGYPMPRVRWTYIPCSNSVCDYSKEIQNSSSYVHRITSTSLGHKLQLRPPQEGLVNCEATNEVGTNATTGLIIFKDTDYGDSFYLRKTNGEYPIIVGDEVAITCVAVNLNFDIDLDWYLNGTRIDGFRVNKQNVHSTKGMEYQNRVYWPSIKQRDAGTYECRKYYKQYNLYISMYYNIELKDDNADGSFWRRVFSVEFLFGFTLPCCFFLFSTYTWCCFRKRTERKLLEKLKADFNEGNPNEIKSDVMLNDQGDLLPYDQTYEFSLDQLHLGKQLGAGAFGIVVKATAIGIISDGQETTVAVKMIKSNANHGCLRSLISELKILIYLGKHLNVVNLLGAVTKNLNKLELLVIVEYCKYGNIQNMLRIHRRQFIDQINRAEDVIDPNIFNSRNEIVETTEPIAAETNTDTVQNQANNSVPNIYSNVTRAVTISTTDLVSWAFQVAGGMQYLTSRNVLHGDLAARNILLCENNVVKICDFGLSRAVQQDPNYRKQSDTPLPFKWLALEAFSHKIFNTYTDIWSFGVLMWEIFSLGEAPYPGMEADERLLMKISSGYRMAKPEFTTQEIYEIMLACWYVKPETRPSFSVLEQQLGRILGKEMTDQYIQLNRPYLQINANRRGNTKTDYAAFMASPEELAPPPPSILLPSKYVNLQTPMAMLASRQEDMVEIQLNDEMTTPM